MNFPDEVSPGDMEIMRKEWELAGYQVEYKLDMWVAVYERGQGMAMYHWATYHAESKSNSWQWVRMKDIQFSRNL